MFKLRDILMNKLFNSTQIKNQIIEQAIKISKHSLDYGTENNLCIINSKLHLFDLKWGLKGAEYWTSTNSKIVADDMKLYRDSTFIACKLADAFTQYKLSMELLKNMNDFNCGCHIIGLFAKDILGGNNLRGLCYHSKYQAEYGFGCRFFEDKLWIKDEVYTEKSEMCAENAAENYVLGIKNVR